MEEEKKEELKEERKGRSTKSKVTTVLLGIALFCMLSILILAIVDPDLLFGDKKIPTKPDDKEEIGLAYEIKDNNLYINNEQVTGVEFRNLSSDAVYKLDDILLVGDCTSMCDWYFASKEAKIIGTIGTIEDANFEKLITPKFEYIDIEKVDGKDLYIFSRKYTGQWEGELCEFARTDVVDATEKFTYNGNGKFGDSQLIKSSTVEDLIGPDKKFKCE